MYYIPGFLRKEPMFFKSIGPWGSGYNLFEAQVERGVVRSGGWEVSVVGGVRG
jgi:hypothetical protein